MKQFQGKAFVFGDNINTDYIISSRRKRDTLDLEILKQYIMEDIRPGFYSLLHGTSILAAGENFGCGSAMEVAAQVVYANSIPVILAKSFARSYYRNAINNGIVIVEMDTGGISEGDNIRVTMEHGGILVENLATGKSCGCAGYDDVVAGIIEYGGLVGYVRHINKTEERGVCS